MQLSFKNFMKKLTNKNTTTTKTKKVSRGTLKELSAINNSDINKKNKVEIIKNGKTTSLSPLKKVDRVSKNETTTTKSTRTLVKKGGNTIAKVSEEKEENEEFVMIEKSVTVRHTSTTFVDDDEESEMFDEDWFGGSKLKKQKQLEEELEEEDLETIMESFGKDDEKSW
jgi:hypothetical protein